MTRSLLCLFCLAVPGFMHAAGFELATFAVDVTPPLGHPCMGGGVAPVSKVIEPLQARGFVLLGGDKPWVLVSFDWCEIRGSAYDQWRDSLSKAVSTDPERVMISCTHVHDAPVMDPEAEHLLHDMERSGAWEDLAPPDPKAAIQMASVCWPDFNRICIQRALVSLAEAMLHRQPVTHLGFGKAEVHDVASNRRYISPDGKVHYNRMSRCTDPIAREASDGDIDPWLRTLSFWNEDKPLCALHSYAVHPMSYYGKGEVSIDFVGLARDAMSKDVMDNTFHIYASGCSGNVTAGKYNDGEAATRAVLTTRMVTAMKEALANTERQPLTASTFRLAKIALGARNTLAHTEGSLRHQLVTEPMPFHRAEPAMGLAWYDRVKEGHKIDLPLIDLGPALVLLLPAESYVEYQLYAEQLAPEKFVLVMGYGECGPGYIPVERAWKENDSNLHSWTWVPPGSEAPMKKAIDQVMKH